MTTETVACLSHSDALWTALAYRRDGFTTEIVETSKGWTVVLT